MRGGVPAGELLPCPFCGAGSPTVWLYREDRKSPVEPQWVAHCKGCNITQKRRRADHAITAWNTRATPTPPIEGRDADVERVAEAIGYKLLELEEDTLAHGLTLDEWRLLARAALQALGERG